MLFPKGACKHKDTDKLKTDQKKIYHASTIF